MENPIFKNNTHLGIPNTVIIVILFSACGKTTFVKDLLQHHNTRIQPTVHRIVWLYRRWQQMYTEIQKTVSPVVEFYQGIPSDINEDEYFDMHIVYTDFDY